MADAVDPDNLPDPEELSEEDVFARTLWGEARGEPREGRIAVACVILNRVARAQDHRRRKGTRFWWGETAKEVCLKPFQFSCWLAADPNLPKMLAVTDADKDFAACLAIARDALAGRLVDTTGGATHYINPRLVDPSWAKSMIETTRIGRHAFFRERSAMRKAALLILALVLSACAELDAGKAAVHAVGQEVNDRAMDDARAVTCNNVYTAEVRYQIRHSIGPDTFRAFCGRNREPAR